MTKKLPSTMSVGRDYRTQLSRYEYVLFAADETLVEQKGGFMSAAQARRHGRNRAVALFAEVQNAPA